MNEDQKISSFNGLVVAKTLPDGTVDFDSVQSLSEWQFGQRNIGLVKHGYGKEFLQILTDELALVRVDEEGLLRSRVIIVESEEDVRTQVMRLLGKIAEALVVRTCNSDLFANRRWAQIGRRGLMLHSYTDDFIAIGTGLETTRYRYPQKYNPTDPHRDIIWIHRGDAVRQLDMLKSGRPAGISAGLQLKVSMDGFRYIYRTDIARARYEVPLVYFDLCNDYYKLANAIYSEHPDVVQGLDIHRGKDISPEIHDALLSHWWLAESVVLGKLSLDKLAKEGLLMDAVKKEHHEFTSIVVTL